MPKSKRLLFALEVDLPVFRFSRCVMVAAAFLAGSVALAEEDEPAQFVEEALSLPAFPKTENLVPFYVSSSSANHFFVDAASVSLGQDGVTRLTLVVESPSGVRNISYEGFRCATVEKKTYAYGRADGSWSQARNPAWQVIRENALNRQHAALFRDYVCVPERTYRTPEQLVGYIRRGETPLAR